MAFVNQSTAKLCKKLVIALVLEKNAIFSRRILSKIAKSGDHNIDPQNFLNPSLSSICRVIYSQI
jgi:hypothetical protein